MNNRKSRSRTNAPPNDKAPDEGETRAFASPAAACWRGAGCGPPGAQEARGAGVHTPDYVAGPSKGSNHTRGGAVDLTLVGADGRALDMGTPVDTMNAASHHFHAAHPAQIQVNRMRLLTVMLEAGFQHHPREWWHYQLPAAQQFPRIGSHAFFRCLPAGPHPATR